MISYKEYMRYNSIINMSSMIFNDIDESFIRKYDMIYLLSLLKFDESLRLNKAYYTNNEYIMMIELNKLYDKYTDKLFNELRGVINY